MTGWRWVDGSRELRRDFWAAFARAVGPDVSLERVEVARLVGIFVQFGFQWVDENTRLPVQEGTRDFVFLEAITLKVDMTQVSKVRPRCLPVEGAPLLR